MSNSAILTAMLVALCVARLATVPFGSGAEQTMQAEGFGQVTQVESPVN